MTEETVGLGPGIKKILTGRNRQIFEILSTAEATVGDEVLTGYEEKFAASVRRRLLKEGDAFELSDNQETVVRTIAGKLKKEGLI